MRVPANEIAALQLFSELDREDQRAVSAVADLARFGPDEVLFAQGDQLADLHILTTGYVAETRHKSGADALTDIVPPGQPVALAPAMLGIATPTGARTLTSARLILVPVDTLRALMRRKPAAGLPFLDLTLDMIARQTVELCNLKLLSSVQRLALFLLDLVDEPWTNPARFVLPYEKRFIAGKLGCSQENLSRAFAALQRLGVETKSGVVVIADTAALASFAGLPPRLTAA
jgi:CRP/FNR family transcriptional activator FtrB